MSKKSFKLSIQKLILHYILGLKPIFRINFMFGVIESNDEILFAKAKILTFQA